MKKVRQADFLHTFERLEKLPDIGHPGLSSVNLNAADPIYPPNFWIQIRM